MIEIKNLDIQRNHQVLLQGLSVTFKSGQFWGVLGRNGLGKTTLLHAITGLLPATKKKIFIDDLPIEQLDIQARARKTSYLLQIQEPCLDFTVTQAISMGQFAWQTKKNDPEAVLELMDKLKISHLKDRSLLHLSGGERRKVELATCLAQKSPHLLLDEPLNHLDCVYQQFLMHLLKEQSKAQAVVMVCHDVNAIKTHCSHVLLLLAKDCYLAGESATILNDNNLQRLFDD
ncbi:ABC transporter ATP-binding protein [Marinicella rhabdoformis]|uniref:ABC transporter ATP-binding protein n=1 Tax=Marinicella rhabdoformis TaxID=2580566 RepID=UPI0012AEB23A|nr:ABC transporter ATP-binding protein [Marinicella rhabdoformis]